MALMREPNGKRELEILPAGVAALQHLGWEVLQAPAEDTEAEQPEEAPKGAEKEAEGREEGKKAAPRRRTAKKG